MEDYRHGGWTQKEGIRMDLSVNTNPFGMPDAVYRIFSCPGKACEAYPAPGYEALKEAVATHEEKTYRSGEAVGTLRERIVLGNGCSELIMAVAHAFSKKKVLLQTPLFSGYERAFLAADCDLLFTDRKEDLSLPDTVPGQIRSEKPEVFVLCSPANPTGTVTGDGLMERITAACRQSGTLLLTDECFLPFVKDCGARSGTRFFDGECKIVILRAFTKIYAMPGLRLGYAVCSDEAIAQRIGRHLPEWNVSGIAREAGIAALSDEDYVKRTTEEIRRERNRLEEGLRSCGFQTIPGEANFIFFYGDPSVADLLFREGIGIRTCDNYRGIEKAGAFRIAVGTREGNDRVLKILRTAYVKDGGRENKLAAANSWTAQAETCSNRPRALMIQGTMSGVGKSLLTAGILRVLAKEGRKAAPFKSQNMALNSFVTQDGKEMGRAQAMQAEAAGLTPRVCMNPILLKPNSDTGSQVILNGKVWKDLDARAYFAKKKELFPLIDEAWKTLCETCDTIIIEGAGSPAEINLKADDIVNMGLAGHLDVPVILVADIDRGGVFAQIYGTMMLLERQERERIKGIIINKFRGDPSLLTPGIKEIERLCGIPVIGVMPYLAIDIEEEDSQSERLGLREREGRINVAVVRLPHLSNYTDFAPLEAEADLNVRYTHRPDEIGEADLVLLPGSKNTGEDLKWLKKRGLGDVIRKRAEEGAVVCGICGGYQMLGKTVVTETGEVLTGLSLLPVRTVFEKDKITKNSKGTVHTNTGILSGLSKETVSGYEIHMGRTVMEPEAAEPFALLSDEKEGTKTPEGCICGNVFGTYLHGLFGSDGFRLGFLRLLAEKKGIGIEAGVQDFSRYKEAQFDALAEAVRTHIDMERIRKLL